MPPRLSDAEIERLLSWPREPLPGVLPTGYEVSTLKEVERRPWFPKVSTCPSTDCHGENKKGTVLTN